MTKRKSHLRTNRYGKTFPVREHLFNAGQASSDYRLTWKHGQAHINGSVTYQTLCPECRKTVFFYRNEHGSRVFFDGLGKPWRKHGCVHGVRKMQAMPVTSGKPVLKEKEAGSSGDHTSNKSVFVDIGNLKSGVDRYNRDVRRAEINAAKAVVKTNKKKKK